MYIVVSSAYKGPNKLIKNIKKEISLFFSKTYQQDFDIVEETWQTTQKQAHGGYNYFCRTLTLTNSTTQHKN
jgi:hypothetical protein